MLSVFLWISTVEAIGLITLPLCYRLLPKLRDRGYSVSKPLGILIIAYISWVLSVTHILPSIQFTIASIFITLTAISGWCLWGHRHEFLTFLSRERSSILTSQIIFFSVYLGWILYRLYDPAIGHTEQPMDHAFLNASIRSSLGPPEDPWLRGESISYYYFGYWMMGVLSEFSGTPSQISYNLALALIAAMGAMGIFGLVYNMVKSDTNTRKLAILSGVIASFLLVVSANLEGLLEFIRSNGMGHQIFWEWIEIKKKSVWKKR
mgnify:FL=1